MSNAPGSRYLVLLAEGKKLSLKQSVLAKCSDCMGNYVDGKIDCAMPECPLYRFNRYGSEWKGREIVKRGKRPPKKTL